MPEETDDTAFIMAKNDDDTGSIAHFRVRCGDCDETWVDSYGGTFTCPSCGSESQQEYVSGFIGLDGPHVFEEQIFPEDDDWPDDA